MKWVADLATSTTEYVDRSRICPICGKPDWCSFLHQVYYNDETGEIYNADFVLCQRINSGQVAGHDGHYYTFISTTQKGVNKYEEVNSSYNRLTYFKKEHEESCVRARSNPHIAPAKRVNFIESPVAEDSRLNVVYSNFLDLLHLEDHHREHFYKEKWDDSMIEDFGVKSLPSSESTYFLSKKNSSELSDYDKRLVDYVKKSTYVIGRKMITEKLVQKVGDLTGVPGFCIVETKKGSYWTFVGDPGFCFPQRNIKGEIVRLHVRADEPYHVSREGKQRGKYKAFSSYYKVKEEDANEITVRNGYKNGCSATPRAGYYFAKNSVLKNPIFMVTEGGKKAFVASRRLNMNVAAVSGVNAYDDVIKDLSDIKKLGVNSIVEAYDADKFVKEGVQNAQINLLNELKKSSFKVFTSYWDGYMGKGLDDVLLNGYMPRIVPVDE